MITGICLTSTHCRVLRVPLSYSTVKQATMTIELEMMKNQVSTLRSAALKYRTHKNEYFSDDLCT
jgi:hypothetical protein